LDERGLALDLLRRQMNGVEEVGEMGRADRIEAKGRKSMVIVRKNRGNAP
jgi:hypothetical protein